jgi:hypothetical protein
MKYTVESKNKITNDTLIEEINAKNEIQLEAYLSIYNRELINILKVYADPTEDLNGINDVLYSSGITNL